MDIIDISLEIGEKTIFYPGDPQFSITRVLDMAAKGDKYNLSKIEIGVHTGTHVDAPLHFIADGKDILNLPLNNFYGKCKVIHLDKIKYNETITEDHLKDKNIEPGLIVLFRTKNSFLYQEKFRKDYISLSVEGAIYLISKKVKAVGIDYLSIGNPEVHHSLLAADIIIYEGLNLTHVDPGFYTFAGFPLKISGSEGSPIRAVLIR